MKKQRAHAPLLLLALAATAALPSLANVQGQLRAGETTYAGTIRWKAAEKLYEITTPQGMTPSFKPGDVRLAIPRPPQLDQAIADLRAGRFASASTGLLPLLPNYVMLVHDEEIASVLAQALTAQNNAAEAVRQCKTVIAARPEAAYRGGMVSAYWNALLAANQTAELEKLLGDAIKTGDIPAMAQACVLRGDMRLRVANPTGDDYRSALVDGYLRVVVLYAREARNVLPEALYKAAECFDKTGQSSRAQSFRERLAGEFPDSAWAAK